jgi:hypothetical protein
LIVVLKHLHHFPQIFRRQMRRALRHPSIAMTEQPLHAVEIHASRFKSDEPMSLKTTMNLSQQPEATDHAEIGAPRYWTS